MQSTVWWQYGILYEVYPRSFQDSNGDGIGDLQGILQRLDYLAGLGIKAVWIAPFYPSPMADFGYDIADYCNIDPIFGTLADFDQLLQAIHKRGLKLILDFVPNHTSDQHPWFLESRSSPDNPKRDWYLWRDLAPGGGPPNNWLSNFGGSAWTKDGDQYYYHSFLKQQPDVNWRNAGLREAMFNALRFWLEDVYKRQVYNCPVYQMLGGQWRDKVRIYADTTESMDPKEYGARAKDRKAMGLTWMKMDLGINVLEGIPGTVMQPSGLSRWELREQPHPFLATEVTDKGIDRLCEYVAAVRDNIGYDMPLSMDHLGHIGVKSCIRLGKAYEKFNLEWIEDVIPWYYTDLLKQITDNSPTPTITGEDIYEIADFENLCKIHAVSKIHPDLATSGGILRDVYKRQVMSLEWSISSEEAFWLSPLSSSVCSA